MTARSLRVFALLSGFACACSRGGGDDDDDTDDNDGGASGACDGIVPGDLVITEVMANPDGEDRGNEYFEIFNASSAELDLAGATLVYGLADSSDEEVHSLGELTIAAGDYLALGTAEAGALPDFIDYGFGNDLGTLRNAGAALALRCGEVEVDRTDYPSAEGTSGVAWVLDGAVAPDHIANDAVANFCPAKTEFAPGLIGSPGQPNEACSPPVLSGTCTEGGVEREAIAPAVGDLVITEFMASPIGTDAELEWFEIHAASDVDLNGLVAGRDGAAELTIDRPECLHVAAGDDILFARSSDPDVNGGLAAVAQTFDFALADDRTLFIGIGEAVLDQIAIAGSVEGASSALDPALLDPVANDDPANFAPCDRPYGPAEVGNTGTPGASNELCAGCPAGSCLDRGTCRPVVSPAPGEIRITEAFANPVAQGEDANQEWFEVEALADFDLNGLGFNEDSRDEAALTIESSECVAVAEGDLLLFARNGDPLLNGGLPAADQLFDFSLNDSGGRLFVSLGGRILDVFPYGTAPSGRARQLDPDGQICRANVEYGGGQFGTPDAANTPCE